MFHWNVLVKKKEKKRGANDVLQDYNLYGVGDKAEQHDNDDNGNDNDSDKHDKNNDKNHEFDQETVQGIEVGTRCKIMSWKYGGEVAPWLSHYGQSLDTLDTDSDGMSDIGSYGRV